MQYREPLFLKPVFQERIWGGEKLRDLYNYNIPTNKTGEAWGISAHPNGPSRIMNGPLKGKTLAEAWQEHGELFHKDPMNKEAYPLLVKILDAAKDLSVQVHPNDAYARSVEAHPYGKTECWYVLQAEPNSEIILGHHADTREDFEASVDNGAWDSLLKSKKVAAGDFIYVPSGTIHAIGKGIVILETQQSSDITYRVYDYDRRDESGNTRELHLTQAKQVTTVPHYEPELKQQVEKIADLTIKELVSEQYFTVYHWELVGQVTKQMDKDFLQCSVIGGTATLTVDDNSFEIVKGDHFIIPFGIENVKLNGNAQLIVSHT
ncbi:MAG: mannose-6-phosphate isomerase, class I [Bacillota bacterium]|uniref:mannose-6-phosphate isomerase, class I n=1 Tax=Virgibacillus TaxID=84406 RepID=UPI0003F886E3|nr:MULTISPECIES: mannose-6-phosphate isomerase, class I [Bacillaceae]MCC2249943.1 mannose-6-phosphate isomerase, class I [Virgibacillus sp. AGTR]MDY7044146.1 mannose-6-phosphate isomerase, class I [Virgibacillus sp. M23]QRZ18200.1 mannose-6-phosphate isomerase, class I [Virgibacillus sp. AGTR]WBX82125.1 mannose-6-phosphate isomerase, class I [Virgibacillus salarius]